MESNEETPTELRIKLSKRLAKLFLDVKRYYLLENNSEVIRTLIREKYEEIMAKKGERKELAKIKIGGGIRKKILCKQQSTLQKGMGVRTQNE